MKNLKKMSKQLIVLLLVIAMLLMAPISSYAEESDLTTAQENVIEEAANFLEDMGMEDMADNIRLWLDDDKINIDSDMSANGTCDREGNITLKSFYVNPLSSDPLKRFKQLVALGTLLIHEKTHAHQAPEGGALAYEVEPGDWLAGYDVHSECIGPDPLEVDAYYNQILAYLNFAQKVSEEIIDVSIQGAERVAALKLKQDKIDYLIGEANRWAKILKAHNFEKANRFDYEYLTVQFNAIDNNGDLTDEQKIQAKKDLLENLINNLFAEDSFYDRARDIYEIKKGESSTNFQIPLLEIVKGSVYTFELPEENGFMHITGLGNFEMEIEAFGVVVHDFAIPPVADYGYEIISPVYSVSWNATLPVEFILQIMVDASFAENGKIAAFALNRDIHENMWTILDSEYEVIGDISYMTVTESHATMFAIVVPSPSFSDIGPEHWCYGAAERLVGQEIIAPDLILNALLPVSREKFTKYLVKGIGLELLELPIPFTDVPVDSPYFSYISTAYHNGLTRGVDSATFGYGEILSREQSITFLIRAMNWEEEALLMDEDEIDFWVDSFFDVYTEVSSWALPYMAQSIKMEIVKGYPDNTLRGKKLLTQAEVVVLIDRMMFAIKYMGR